MLCVKPQKRWRFTLTACAKMASRSLKPRTVEAIRAENQDWVDMKDALIVTVSLLPPQDKAFVFN
jgi:hypothetical protein